MTKKYLMYMLVGVCLFIAFYQIYNIQEELPQSSSLYDDYFNTDQLSAADEIYSKYLKIDLDFSSSSLSVDGVSSATIEVILQNSEAVKYKVTSQEGYLNDSYQSLFKYIDETVEYSVKSDFERDVIEFTFYDQYKNEIDTRRINVSADGESYRLTSNIDSHISEEERQILEEDRSSGW